MGAVPPREPYWRRCFRARPWRTGLRSAVLGILLMLASLPVSGADSPQPAKGDAAGAPTAAAPAQTASAPVGDAAKPAVGEAPKPAIGGAVKPAVVEAPKPAVGEAAKPAPPPSWAEQQSALCISAVHNAEAKYALPSGLLGTIAKVESGRPITAMHDVRAWPWTIDADGRGYFFESKAAAVAWAKLGLARGVAFMDIGCMQVDLQMHPGAFRSIEEAFDPEANVDYGAHYLQRLHDGDANGNWYVAVGLYHSHTPDLAAAYRGRVAAVGAGILTGFGAPEPLYMRALRQGTLRLTLAGGGILRIHIRQPSLRPPRRLSPCQLAAFLGPDLPAPPRGCGARGR